MKTRTQILAEIHDERCRQIIKEGWSENHDDDHEAGELAQAAGCYALSAGNISEVFDCNDFSVWPWAKKWDKRSKHDKRKKLIIAGALIIAEIERLDRADISDERD